MKVAYEVKLKSGLWKIADSMMPELDKVVRRSAFAVERLAKENAPVDTSALMNSIHTVTSRQNGYDKAATKVRAALARRNEKPRPMFRALPQPKQGEAIVAVAMEYGYPVEVLHASKRWYMKRAVESCAGAFKAAVTQAMNDAARKGEVR